MRDSGWRSIRFLAVTWLVAALLCGSFSAARALTVFSFGDFPPHPGLDFDEDAVNTTLYGCNGKTFCTNLDVADVRDNAIASISTTRDGIRGVFARPPLGFPAGVGIFPFSSSLNPGNVEGSGDYVPYVADFSRQLRLGEVTVSLNSENELGDFAFLEIWSGPEATGTLLDRTELSLASISSVHLSLTAPAGNPFRSMRFGVAFDAPGCESGCAEFEGGGEQGFAGGIGVEPIPEPSAALLFGAALLVVRRVTRRRA